MKCSDCALFMEYTGPDGNYICFLCTGTFVTSKEMISNICKYTGESITEEYASIKYWLNPFEDFQSKIRDIQEILNYALNTAITSRVDKKNINEVYDIINP